MLNFYFHIYSNKKNIKALKPQIHTMEHYDEDHVH